MHSLRAATTALLALSFLLRSASAAPPMPIVDQDSGPGPFLVFLRVEFFAPVGQSFVPEFRRHVGVNLFLRNFLIIGDQPPAIYTATLRTDSVTGPILATGSTPPLPLFERQWMEILFDEPVSLVPGDLYYLEVSTANVSGFWGRAGLNPYPAGVGYEQGSATPHFDFGFQTLVLPIEEIELDIKPRQDPNSINPSSNGMTRVAILGSDTFEVADVDVTTLAFGPGGAMPVNEPTRRRAPDDHARDVNDDGFTDLIARFRTQDIEFADGDEEACISGALHDGTEFEGCDAVQLTAPRSP